MKTLLLDADGVTLRKMGYFSERLSQDHNIPLDAVVQFFKNEYRLCQTGKADLREQLKIYLPKWGWDKGIDAFLEYWFVKDTRADDAVLREVARIRQAGTPCFLVTDQEKYRATYILEQLNFKNNFDGCFFSYELGSRKSGGTFFTQVLTTLAVVSSDITYFDDEQEDINKALNQGISAQLYTGIDDLKKL